MIGARMQMHVRPLAIGHLIDLLIHVGQPDQESRKRPQAFRITTDEDPMFAVQYLDSASDGR